jgi:hypothetical protein
MALSPEDRKKLLGYGGLTRIAKRSKRSFGHVTQVNKSPEIRTDAKVMRAITREIVKKHPHIAETDVWPVVLA